MSTFPHAVCILEVAKGAQKATADAPVMVLAGLFKTQAGIPHITPKALKVSSDCDLPDMPPFHCLQQHLALCTDITSQSECLCSHVQHIQRMPSLVDHLAQRPRESARLLHSLIRALLTDRVHTAASLDLLGHVVSQVDLGGLAQAAAEQILSCGPGAEEEELQTLMSIFRWADFLFCMIFKKSSCWSNVLHISFAVKPSLCAAT